MQHLTLESDIKSFVKTYTQRHLAKALGISPGAVNLALQSGRNIWVEHGEDGEVLHCYEVRNFPSREFPPRSKAA